MLKHQHAIHVRLANAEFLRAFLVEAIELRLGDAARIDAAIDELIRQAIEDSVENHDLDALIQELHGDPRLRDRSRELSTRRNSTDNHDVHEWLLTGLPSLGQQAKLAFLGERLGLKGAIEALAQALRIDETDKTRILYENLLGHQVQPREELRRLAA
ncbi:MAG: hypothetical protein QM617_12405 [Comamonas sp.]